MNIALFAATGRVGSAILEELVSRGHQVTAVARNIDKLPGGLPATVRPVQADFGETDKLTEIIAGTDADAVVSAFGLLSTDPHYTTDTAYTDELVGVMERLIAAVRKAGAPRLVVVGGAGSLWFSPGVTVLDSGHWPAPYQGVCRPAGIGYQLDVFQPTNGDSAR